MQIFGNVATLPEQKHVKTSGKTYWEMRVCESQRGVDASPTWYTVRVMKDEQPELAKGDFVKVTGKLRVDSYLSRDGKPASTLLVIAFEAQKIAKPNSVAAVAPEPKRRVPEGVQRADRRNADDAEAERTFAELYEA